MSQELRVDLIDDGQNVRESTDPGLVASIRRHGVLQPITVRRTGKRYVVVMGFRRLAAARIVGLETIPGQVEEQEHDDQILRQVAENVHRRAMNPIDVARALHAYLEAHPTVSKKQLGIAMGYHSRYGSVWVANKLALLRLDDVTMRRVEARELSEQLALKQRARLNDGRGHPRVVSAPNEHGRSRSIDIEISQTAGGKARSRLSIGVDHEARSVDVVVEQGERRLFLTLSRDEARLLGRRLTQAWEAIA